jgi:hypothetical protein
MTSKAPDVLEIPYANQKNYSTAESKSLPC